MFFRRTKASDGNIFLIVGLGNPGREYSDSRHNCGFKAIECLASKLSGLTPFKEKHRAMLAKCRLDAGQLIIACPVTYMNASGESVRELLNYYKLPSSHLMVIYDDIDNRIRIGIGKPPAQMQLADFVLGKFTQDELPLMQCAYQRAADCALEFASSGIEKAMAKYNINVKEQAR